MSFTTRTRYYENFIFLFLLAFFGTSICKGNIIDPTITRFEIRFKINTNCRVMAFWVSEHEEFNGNKQFEYKVSNRDEKLKLGWSLDKKVNSVKVNFYLPLNEEIDIMDIRIDYGNESIKLTPGEILEYTFLSNAFEIVRVEIDKLILRSRKTTNSPKIRFDLSTMLARKIRKQDKNLNVETEVKIKANVNKKALVKLYYSDSSRLSFNNNYELMWLGDTSGVSTITTMLRTKRSIHSLAFYFSRQDSVHLNIKEISINDGSNFVKFSAKDIYNNFFTSDNLGMHLADSNTIKLKSYYLDNDRYYTLSTNNILSPLSIKFQYTLNIVAKLPANSLVKVNYYDLRLNNYHYLQRENVRHYNNTVANDFNNFTFNINTERELLGFRISFEGVDANCFIRNLSLINERETQNWDSEAIIENFKFSDNTAIDILNGDIMLYDKRYKSNKFNIESNSRFLFDKHKINYIYTRSIGFSIMAIIFLLINIKLNGEAFRRKFLI